MLRVAFIAALSLASSWAHADPCAVHSGGVESVPGPVELELWQRVQDAMELPSETPPPAICVVGRSRLQEIRDAQPVVGRNLTEAVALYDRERGHVLLGARIDGASEASRSILLHEFVHHAQALSERRFACPQMAEAEAYRLQDAYLSARGLSLTKEIGLDGLLLVLLTNCPI